MTLTATATAGQRWFWGCVWFEIHNYSDHDQQKISKQENMNRDACSQPLCFVPVGWAREREGVRGLRKIEKGRSFFLKKFILYLKY